MESRVSYPESGDFYTLWLISNMAIMAELQVLMSGPNRLVF